MSTPLQAPSNTCHERTKLTPNMRLITALDVLLMTDSSRKLCILRMVVQTLINIYHAICKGFAAGQAATRRVASSWPEGRFLAVKRALSASGPPLATPVIKSAAGVIYCRDFFTLDDPQSTVRRVGGN